VAYSIIKMPIDARILPALSASIYSIVYPWIRVVYKFGAPHVQAIVFALYSR
jgi:hypothetical protein